MSEILNIGILAVQGAFAEHVQMFEKLGVHTFLIRQAADLTHPMDGLVLPGGESTVQGKLLRELDLFFPLKDQITAGLPVFGTCAGMILLAKQLYNDPVVHFGVMDITVRRNAYGRQLGSFFTKSKFGNVSDVEMPFIRAPYIESVGSGVQVLSVVDGKCVAARENNMLAISFHPEVAEENTVHKYFIDMIVQSKKESPLVHSI